MKGGLLSRQLPLVDAILKRLPQQIVRTIILQRAAAKRPSTPVSRSTMLGGDHGAQCSTITLEKGTEWSVHS